jgi:hypothetical protein
MEWSGISNFSITPSLPRETKFEKVNMFRRIANPAELSYEYLNLD